MVDGSFVNAAGGRLLMEVESDGHGGFNTDHLIFRNGSTVSLAGVDVRFRFLGTTDPGAFKARACSTINNFFQGQDALGQNVNLPGATFDGATFSAQSDAFTFTSFRSRPRRARRSRWHRCRSLRVGPHVAIGDRLIGTAAARRASLG